MGVSVNIRSDGEGNAYYRGARLLPEGRTPLGDRCWFEVRQLDMSGGHAHAFETWIVVKDEQGSRVGICVDREGEYSVGEDRAFPVGGPDHAFDRPLPAARS